YFVNEDKHPPLSQSGSPIQGFRRYYPILLAFKVFLCDCPAAGDRAEKLRHGGVMVMRHLLGFSILDYSKMSVCNSQEYHNEHGLRYLHGRGSPIN
ncbi:MAG: hypothetical protein LBK67_09065, partial [Coriobacteriales bacterium]|nr:hypothetical protein [Coriobacteriales bacterium]